MIVADTNLVALLLLGSQEERASAAALSESDEVWLAPVLWRSEFLSVLRKHVALGLSVEGASALFYEACERVSTDDAEQNPDELLALSVATGCSTYDCEFAGLAMRSGVRLVTLDRKVLRAFPEIARHPGRVPLD